MRKTNGPWSRSSFLKGFKSSHCRGVDICGPGMHLFSRPHTVHNKSRDTVRDNTSISKSRIARQQQKRREKRGGEGNQPKDAVPPSRNRSFAVAILVLVTNILLTISTSISSSSTMVIAADPGDKPAPFQPFSDVSPMGLNGIRTDAATDSVPTSPKAFPPKTVAFSGDLNPSNFKLRLPTPVFVVGMPKVGTTSIHEMFVCNGIASSHYCCCGSKQTHGDCGSGATTFAKCMQRNLFRYNKPILEGCGDYDVYAQLDAEDGQSVFLPQHFHLADLHAAAPEATLLLNLRPAGDWVRSVRRWFGFGKRFVNRFVPAQRQNKTLRNAYLEEIFENHTARVREFATMHPSHALVEVDISTPNAGHELAAAFGLDPSCWGKHNQNNHTMRAKKP